VRLFEIVREADVADVALLLELARERQLRLRIAQIVNLQQLDPIRFQSFQGCIELSQPFVAAGHPGQLGGQPTLGPQVCIGQQASEHVFGVAVGRCGVDDGAAACNEEL
jgi:hypothetical protein